MALLAGAVSAVENITKCVRRCGLEVKDVILQPLASAIAVLNDDEKELGVAVTVPDESPVTLFDGVTFDPKNPAATKVSIDFDIAKSLTVTSTRVISGSLSSE
mgnify:CR=1 FL=1